ncbi:MAG TPA: DUF3043 domain-containing protein [Nocardioidaceae bacterium]|nr:DUF3043 domain-containing protein [Nocardioidaceae bacterium]
MFRRTKAEEPTSAVTTDPDLGKGRPTPTRKEAEAAAKARAKAAKDPKAARAMMREKQKANRGTSSKEIRQGIKAGDERYLGRRDSGPVRRFVRDFIDTRLNIAEFSIPLMFSSLLLSGANPNLGGGILNATVLLVTVDSIWLVVRLKRELKRRFPGPLADPDAVPDPSSTKAPARLKNPEWKGTTFYALTRALQLRFMRIPKAQVKIGQKLPDTYR